ncbi:MAG TPA: hypothetical protein VF503_13990 [Sphingobium sp.]|uniref:hypothetical protein n=1 Tax=Sphingobium sp. TaxID=1912891 RepID=UPI002ED26D8E
MRFFTHLTLISAIASVLTIAPSIAQSQSTGLEDMVGARAGQAEGELQRRGYRNVGGAKGDDRSYTYWWNDNRRQCVSIATMNGRYSSVTPTTAPDCGQHVNRDERRPSRFDRHERSGSAYVAPDDLSRVCRNEAAAAFDRRPSEVTANAPIKQRNGYLVQGWYDRRDHNKGTKFFNCRFDEDGRFLGVS